MQKLIRLACVIERTTLTRSGIYRLIQAGEFPQPVKLHSGGRTVVWPESVIEAWIEQRCSQREVG